MKRIAAAQGGSGRSCSHVMPAWAGAVAGIYGCFYIRSFFLIRTNQRIKADIIGPNAQSGRNPPPFGHPLKGGSPPCRPAHAPNPAGFWRSRTRHKDKKQHSNGPSLTLYPHGRPSFRECGTPSPIPPEDYTPCRRFAPSPF
ncbi:MAG: hypothetical protein IKS53_02145 [Bacteroidales bacterium]|nr:hypothetical protein [Bacteroidales bacterium]